MNQFFYNMTTTTWMLKHVAFLIHHCSHNARWKKTKVYNPNTTQSVTVSNSWMKTLNLATKIVNEKICIFELSRLEWFSFECRKVIGFAFATLHDWLKKFAPIFHPIRSKTKTNRDSLARVFLRFASAICNYFEFWLVHCIVCVLCDWLE